MKWMFTKFIFIFPMFFAVFLNNCGVNYTKTIAESSPETLVECQYYITKSYSTTCYSWSYDGVLITTPCTKSIREPSYRDSEITAFACYLNGGEIVDAKRVLASAKTRQKTTYTELNTSIESKIGSEKPTQPAAWPLTLQKTGYVVGRIVIMSDGFSDYTGEVKVDSSRIEIARVDDEHNETIVNTEVEADGYFRLSNQPLDRLYRVYKWVKKDVDFSVQTAVPSPGSEGVAGILYKLFSSSRESNLMSRNFKMGQRLILY
jgi:hypothetical protein